MCVASHVYIYAMIFIVCIDQYYIQLDLRCLPIFGVNCYNLLVTSRATYTSRLWSCVEFFVYATMCRY